MRELNEAAIRIAHEDTGPDALFLGAAPASSRVKLAPTGAIRHAVLDALRPILVAMR